MNQYGMKASPAGFCPRCKHDWREHPGGDFAADYDGCRECVDEFGRGQLADESAPVCIVRSPFPDTRIRALRGGVTASELGIVNGEPPRLTLGARTISEWLHDHTEDQNAQLVAPLEQRDFVLALLGHTSADDDLLSPERTPIAFCGLCRDASCGQMLAAEIVFTADTVSWLSIGYEQELWGPPEIQSRRWFSRRTAPFLGWGADPIEPRVGVVFNRTAYTSTLREALHRLGD